MLYPSLALGAILAAASASSVTIRTASLSKLTKRNVLSVGCGKFPSADPGDAQTNRDNLAEKTDCVTVAAGTCNRFGCYNTSGFWACNDQSVDICVSPAGAAEIAAYADVVCLPEYASFSAQTFTDNHGGYNVVEGYANCNYLPDRPEDYGSPNEDVNGYPAVTCGIDGSPPCVQEDTNLCVDGSIEVTHQSQEICGAYLLEQYIGSGDTYTYSTTSSISETWTVGGSLGISAEILKATISASFDTSFSRSTSIGDSVGISAECGEDLGHNGQLGNWTCAMEIQPFCLRTSGYCSIADTEQPDVMDPVLGYAPFELLAPMVNSQGDGLWSPSLCVCSNCAGWAEGGAPQQACDLPCAACKVY